MIVTIPAKVSHAERKRIFTRATILDTAARLIIEHPKSDFSMRDLAEAAGMAVTTLFSHFGSKGGVLRGLIDRLIDEIEEGYDKRSGTLDSAIDRLFVMAEVGVEVVLARPAFSKRILGSLLADSEDHVFTELKRQTNYIWMKALGDGVPLIADVKTLWSVLVPEQLTITFRGALAVWIAEKVPDDQFRRLVVNSVLITLLGFIQTEDTERLFARALL